MLVETMHTMASSLQVPVIILLIALVVVVVAIVGTLIAEVFTERRYFKLSIPDLIDELQGNPDTEGVIAGSGMLGRQKNALIEIVSHPDATKGELESMAVELVAEEQSRFDNRVRVTDFIAKAAPLIGLMGTLIPLGPGIIAIGSGDVEILSQSLLIAFDTTILGLIVAAVSLLVSTIRKAWYNKYMAAYEAATECVLEKACERVDARVADDVVPVIVEPTPMVGQSEPTPALSAPASPNSTMPLPAASASEVDDDQA